jgi:aminoglycoside phosphotransferase (APT) family kinase protein
MPEWDPELVVDEDLAHQLIATQFPQLRVSSLRLLARGWDNTVHLVNEDTVFRFPRRAIAVPGVEREIAVLPALAPHLPLAIPVPTFIGHRTDAFAWPFFGSRLVSGRELADAGLTDTQRGALAVPLARFLRALHAQDVAAALGAELPLDPNRRADMTLRVPMTRARFVALERAGVWQAPEIPWLDTAESLPPSTLTVVTHGDLHLRHVLVDAGGALSGVIDWGDIGRSDPAIDLTPLWSLLPSSARPAFLAAYGVVSEAALLRARVLALFLSATLALYGHAEGLPALTRESIASLERALTE